MLSPTAISSLAAIKTTDKTHVHADDAVMIERVAEAMRLRRRELIAQPLDRIWFDLARTAVAAING